MIGIDGIIEQINTHLESAFCASAETKFCGIIDLVEKNGQTFPIDPADGSGVPIIPEGNNPIRIFWELTGDISYEDREGYGDGKQYILNLPVRIYLVGLMSILDSECFSSTRSVITELADSLPKKPFALSAEIESVQIRSLSINYDRRDILTEIYAGSDINNKILDLIAGSIEFDIVAYICENLCGDLYSATCDPGTIKNSAGTTIGTVESGGSTTVSDSNVSNSDDSYSVNVPATTDWELPNINISNSNDSYSVNIPAVQDHELNDVTISVEDQDGNPLGSEVVPAAVDQTISVTISSPSGTLDTLFSMGTEDRKNFRMGVDITIQSETLTNISSYDLYINEVLTPVVFPLALTKGDRIRIEITRTNPATQSRISWEPNDLINNILELAGATYYPRWETLQNMTIERQDDFVDYFEPVAGTANAWTNAAYTERELSPPCTLFINGYLNNRKFLFIGLNDEAVVSTPANYYARLRYSVYCFNDTAYRFFELNVQVAAFTTNESRLWYIYDDGTFPKYYYSDNLGITWALGYTSTLASSGGPYRQDLVSYYDNLIVLGGMMQNN